MRPETRDGLLVLAGGVGFIALLVMLAALSPVYAVVFLAMVFIIGLYAAG